MALRWSQKNSGFEMNVWIKHLLPTEIHISPKVNAEIQVVTLTCSLRLTEFPAGWNLGYSLKFRIQHWTAAHRLSRLSSQLPPTTISSAEIPEEASKEGNIILSIQKEKASNGRCFLLGKSKNWDSSHGQTSPEALSMGLSPNFCSVPAPSPRHVSSNKGNAFVCIQVTLLHPKCQQLRNGIQERGKIPVAESPLLPFLG